MELTLFLLSDLHAFDGRSLSAPIPSHFDISRPSGSANNPLRDLHALIAEEGLKADYLVCCGDLADKAVPIATECAWKELQEIAAALAADRTLATVGNHDVDSRHIHNDHDARGVLLELTPPFPFADEETNCLFWTHHYAVINDPTRLVRFVVLNSSAYHGEGSSEMDHGRVSERTRQRLLKCLRTAGKARANILICHHHPQKHSELSLGDYDDMKGGYDLLSALSTTEHGPWLVIHGHKHHPKLCYAQGGSTSPVVFSLGSCAAILPPPLIGVRNQVYLLKLQIPTTGSSCCSGSFLSWDWGPGLGWRPAQMESGLPARGGFGYRGDLAQIASEIVRDHPNGGRWHQIVATLPKVQHLLPVDLEEVLRLLKADYKYRIELGRDGQPLLIDPPLPL